jgi:hypothetical protein
MPDSYPKSWPRTMDSVGTLAFDQILPGHGPIMDRRRMKNMRDFIEEATARVEEAKEAGKTLAETRASIPAESLRTLQVDGYGEYIWAVRDSLFPHWGRTFVGQPPSFQGSLNGMLGNIYRSLDRE